MDEATKDLVLQMVKERLDAHDEENPEYAGKITQSVGSKGCFVILAFKYPDTDPIRKERLKDAHNNEVAEKFESL